LHYKQDGIAVPRHHLKGETIEYDGPPSVSMVPLDKPAKERVFARNAERVQEQEKIRQNAGRSSVGWSPALQKSVMKQLAGKSSD